MDDLPFFEGDDLKDLAKENFQVERSKTSKQKEGLKYAPLNIESNWFESKQFTNQDEELTFTKFRAHAAFFKGEYSGALILYEKCKEILPANANLLLREVCESQARCLMHLQRFAEAKGILESLLDEKGNPQDSSLFSLLSEVSMAMNEFDGAAENLRKCVLLHPDYSDYWLKVANLFKEIAESKDLFKEHVERNDEKILKPIAHISYFVDLFLRHVEEGKNAIMDTYEQCNGIKTNQFKLIDEEIKEGDNALSDDLSQEGILASLADEFKKSSIKDTSCNCFRLLGSLIDFSTLTTEDPTNRVPTQEFTRLFLKNFTVNEQCSFNDFKLKSFSNQEAKPEPLHFKLWSFMMKITQCCSLAKACLLHQKTVQYSKGFVKEAESKRLHSVQQSLLEIVGSKDLLQWLLKVVDMPLSTDKPNTQEDFSSS